MMSPSPFPGQAPPTCLLIRFPSSDKKYGGRREQLWQRRWHTSYEQRTLELFQYGGAYNMPDRC